MSAILEQISSIFVMLLLFGLILYGSYYCSRKVAKMSMRDASSKYMKLKDRMMLGQDKQIAIVSVGERHFLIGTSGNSISMLAELQPEELEETTSFSQSFASGYEFRDILKRLKKSKDLPDGNRGDK